MNFKLLLFIDFSSYELELLQCSIDIVFYIRISVILSEERFLSNIT